MSDAREYRDNARTCGVLAQVTHSPVDHLLWHNMSEAWLKLASLEDRKGARPDEISPARHVPIHIG